ncbi:hypothetical protein JTB14_000260 [Gonioctena quinquepunctata]|nr:hypothetical protein JTB14_000260 [Gonioctena quinquepunctata]
MIAGFKIKSSPTPKKVAPIFKIVEGGIAKGEVEFVRFEMEYTDSVGSQHESSNTYFLLPVEVDDSGVIHIRTLFECLEEWKEKLPQLAIQQVTMGTTGRENLQYIRKCTEYVLICEVEIIFPGKIYMSAGGSNEAAGVKTGKLIIKSEGRSYAELMKAVKRKANLDAKDIAVKAIRKTNGGDQRQRQNQSR